MGKGCSYLEFTPRPGGCHPLPDPPHRHPTKRKPLLGGEVRTSSQHRLGLGGAFFFLFIFPFFFFCNMFGVNVAKSSLHLHFLKTLEFRTDVSVTSTILHGDPRSETQSNSLPKSFCSSCSLPRLVHANTAFGHQTSEGLCTSALLRGRFLSCSPESGSKGTTRREGLPDPAPAWTPWAQIQVQSPPCQSCYVFVLFYCSSFFPFPDDWFLKRKLLRKPWQWGGGARRTASLQGGGWCSARSLGRAVWIAWCLLSGAPGLSCVRRARDVPQPHPLLQPS